MKAGTQILVTWIRPEGDVTELAKISCTRRDMLPLPTGYVPVRFSDGGVLLVHTSAISEVCQ